MTFEDLTPWDLDLIRSHGIHALAFTRCEDRYQALAQCTLNCIHAKGFNIQPESKTLLKSMVNALHPKGGSPSVNDVIKEVFTYLRINNLEIVKDEKRECTWSQPRDSWYAKNDPPKKPWVF